MSIFSSRIRARTSVSQNTTVQQLLRGGDPLAEPLELELDRDGRVRFPGAAADEAPPNDPQTPAARVEFPAEELLERRLLEKRVAVPADQAPALGDRPHEREVALLDDVAAIAIGEAEQPILGRAILEARFHARRALGIAVPLITDVEIPRVAQADRHLGHVVGGIRVDRLEPGK